MIRHTVRRIGQRLEELTDQGLPMDRAFDLLCNRARAIEEIVVIEVMREVYQEIEDSELVRQAYADSSTRSARMPAMALSR